MLTCLKRGTYDQLEAGDDLVAAVAEDGRVEQLVGTQKAFPIPAACRGIQFIAGMLQCLQLGRIQVPEEAITDLRRRIRETRWPEQETVSDRSQGNQLANMQEIVRYWGSGYD